MSASLTTAPDQRSSADTPAARAPGRGRRRLLLTVERYGLLVLAVAVAVLFSVLPSSSDTFATTGNLRAVLGSISVVAVVALAALFPLLTGHFDFTVGAVAGLTSVVTATVMSRFDGPLALAVLTGIGFGTLVGAVNSILIARLKFNAFIVTLGGATLISGLVQWYTGGIDITSGLSAELGAFGSGLWFGLPRPFYLVLALSAASLYLLRATPFGRRVQAVGANDRAANLVGINVTRAVTFSFLASGTLAGIAGVLLTARNGGAVAGSGADQLFPALTAVFLGATAFDPGRYNVLGTIVGVFFVAMSISGLTLSGAASWVPDVFNGSALIVAVGLSTLLARQRRTQTTP